jgi:hypothetical protein
MKEEKIIEKCTLCGNMGKVTRINPTSRACEDCLPFVWTRRNPGKPLPESLETIKLAFVD